MVFEYLDGTSKDITVKSMATDEIKNEWYI